MIYFKSADELKKKYEVYANFYKMKYADGEPYICRNVADIYDIEYKKSNRHRNNELKPHALIIMMNPGMCEPKDDKVNIPYRTIDDLKSISIEKPGVLCKTDNAQYQVMRIMDIKGWKHMRILNLSDIRCSNGEEFKKTLNKLQKADNLNSHSIFSKRRSEERENLLQLSENAPIIFAWGTDKILRNLAKECENSISHKQGLKQGLGVKHSDYLYYYASCSLKDRKIEWLEKISEIV